MWDWYDRMYAELMARTAEYDRTDDETTGQDEVTHPDMTKSDAVEESSSPEDGVWSRLLRALPFFLLFLMGMALIFLLFVMT